MNNRNKQDNFCLESSFEQAFLECVSLGLANIKLQNQTISVALSGGADSTCLAVLLHYLGLKLQFKVVCLIVDHQLRPESTSEAILVQNYIKDIIGIETHILTWQHDATLKRKSSDGGIQAIARKARYDLLNKYCQKNSIKILCTAHTQNDQAETVLMRLLRGSGINGLSGISPQTIYNNNTDELIVLRPLLNYQRNEIENYLQKLNISWVNDPSNHKLQYDRVMIRKLLGSMVEFINTNSGAKNSALIIPRIAMVANNARRSNEFIELEVKKKMQSLIVWKDESCALLDLSAFMSQHEEIKLRMLKTVLLKVGGNNSLRLSSLLNALGKLNIKTVSNNKILNSKAEAKSQTNYHNDQNKLRQTQTKPANKCKFTLANCILVKIETTEKQWLKITKEK